VKLLKEKAIKFNRAWVEINLDNLCHNVNEIKKVIPSKCKIMAVVKANAYGHGLVEVSKKLSSIGINDFAVATVSEGVILRRNGIKGNILILGYTDFKDIGYVIKYNLTQTIVDYEYGYMLSKMNLKNKINVYIKINTGMNRIGEDYKNIDRIKNIYEFDNFNIQGSFSHFSACDSLESDDIEFTNMQISNFYNVIDELKKSGYNVGKIHIQSSYSILNYPELNCDYVRPGIIMYGIDSEKNKTTKIKLNLKPVLSLKAKVTSVKVINDNEAVGYGRTFKANKSLKIASISIGYADGYPRCLSNSGVKVLVNGEYATVIGRVCMDQLMIDVSNIEDIKIGDTVTLIGSEKLIRAEEIAYNSRTIANELLSRLGNRLEYKFIEKN